MPPRPEHDLAGDEVATGRRRTRLVAARVTTVLAGLLVLVVLVAPSETGRLTPAAFLRIPGEALLAVGLILVLPARAGRAVAVAVGVGLGLLALVKVADLGFFTVLDRPFDPVFDWSFLEAAVVFLTQSVGRAGAVAAVIGVGLVVVGLLALMAWAVLRLRRLVLAHRDPAARGVVVVAVAWLMCAVLGVRLVPDVPVAAHGYYDRLVQVGTSLRDREVFAAQAAVDAFRDTPGRDLLTGLRGKDVVVTFVESYGRVAVEHPELAPRIGALLDAGDRRLRAAGFTSRSGFLTSPTAGGGSWLAHATLLSGLWVDNQQRYRDLLGSDRLTLNRAFRHAGWRTVGVLPGVILDWPEGVFFGYDRIYAAKDLGYRGPNFSFATMPDQYTLSAFQRAERAAVDRGPVMADIPLVSSHAPWAPIPRLLDWDEVGDGSTFDASAGAGDPADVVLQREGTRVRADYRQSIEYSLTTVISYVETYGDDDLVLVFLGDHQPAQVVTGTDATRDVPVTIVARDPAVLDRVSGWGWHDGLRPGPQAPVWRMDTFRDRFLTTFGPRRDPGPVSTPR